MKKNLAGKIRQVIPILVDSQTLAFELIFKKITHMRISIMLKFATLERDYALRNCCKISTLSGGQEGYFRDIAGTRRYAGCPI